MEKSETVGFEIRTLHNLIKRDIERSCAKQFGSTTGVHGWAISYFYRNRNRDIFQRDFEDHFSIRRSTATKILQLMEKNGLIIRESVDYDARLKRITLTEKAVKINNLIMADIKSREKRMSRGISDDELTAFFKTVSKIKANLEDADDQENS